MAITINTNVASLNSQRQLATSQNTVNTAMQRLSSGLRINSAKDDAAGLAISDRMTSQIRGMNQAARNLNDGISMLRTAEGALQEVTNMIQRGRELAVQAGNEATLSDSDKASLQEEVGQLIEEIDRIADTTEFNGIKLLNRGGTRSEDTVEQQAILDGLKSSWLAQSEKRIEEEYGLTGNGIDFSVSFVEDSGDNRQAWMSSTISVPPGTSVSAELTVDLSDFDVSDTDFDRIIAHEMTHAIMAANMDFTNTGMPTWFKEGTAEFMAGGDERLSASLSSLSVSDLHDTLGAGGNVAMTTSDEYAASYTAVRYLHDSIQDAGGDGIKDVMVYLRDNTGASLDDALSSVTPFASEAAFLADFQGAAGEAFTQALVDDGKLSNADVGAIGGLDADGGAVLTADSVVPDTLSYSDDPLVAFAESWPDLDFGSGLAEAAVFAMQAGANAGETITVTLGSADTETLNIADVDIAVNPSMAISRFDEALVMIDELRGEMGAVMNRLESSISGVMNAVEQASAARSRILDADIAMETTAMTKGNILQQAGVSILAQANQGPQLALSLLQ